MFFWSYLRTSSGRTEMLLLEKNIFLYSNCYLFTLINRESIHPIDRHVHKEVDDFTLEDLEDFLGLNYISKKNFPAFYIAKGDGLLFRSTGRGILL